MESKPTFSDLDPEAIPQVPAGAIAALMAAMTRWEPLTAESASQRVRRAAQLLSHDSLVAAIAPTLERGSWRDLQSWVGSLAELRGTRAPCRLLALRAALEVALGSGSLPLTQNLALRTVVDALALEMAELRSLFLARTGSELPRLWDPSSPPAWLGRSGEAPGPDGTWDDGGPHPGPGYRAGEADGRGLSRLKALALLGLDEEASAEEIQRAYHRVTRVHHPDRYLAQGPEATLEAEETFRRIKAAYDFLTRVAP